MRSANHAKEPQACGCRRNSEGFVSKNNGDEQGEQRCGRDNDDQCCCDRCGLFIAGQLAWSIRLLLCWLFNDRTGFRFDASQLEGGGLEVCTLWSGGRTDGLVGSRPTLLRSPRTECGTGEQQLTLLWAVEDPTRATLS